MAQGENGNKEGNNDRYKIGREGIKGVSDSVGESLRGNWENVGDIWDTGECKRHLFKTQIAEKASEAAGMASEAAERASETL